MSVFLSITDHILKEISDYRLLYSCSDATYCYHEIDNEIIIFLQGVGNFGDVWYRGHQFKEKVITLYPDNKIIILHQTVWYADKDILLHDVNTYSSHKNLILCAKDRNSYAFLKKHFTKIPYC
jgi:pyruvyl transferase EpsO